MHITVTSISSQETNKKLNEFSADLEDSLNKYLSVDSFGPINRFMFVIVAVYEDAAENDRFCQKNNKSGTYKHPVTSERVKYFSIAVPYSPEKILSTDKEDLRKNLCSEIIRHIDNPQVKIPKGVEYERFSEKIKLALEIYSKSNFTYPK